MGALRSVQAVLIETLKSERAASGRPLPTAVARLVFDASDPNAGVPEPLPARHLSKEDAVVALAVISTENVILPFEIYVPEDIAQKALEDLTAEMGYGGIFGTNVASSAKRAADVLGGAGGVNWGKIGAVGAGVLALAAVPGALFAVAGAGLTGAAALTSALAAFGPGGMIGGLLTAGSLVTVGGGSVAFGLTSPSTPPAAMEAVVSRQLMAEILRAQHNLPPHGAVWRNLVEMEIQLGREYERLDEFSDPSAPSIKALKRKIETVERALAHLVAIGVAPVADGGEAEEAPPPWFKKFLPGIG